jgi:hypothetical protein
MIKGQDILVLLKLLIHKDEPAMAFHRLASELEMSPAEVHQGIKRSEQAGLVWVSQQGRSHEKKVNLVALEEFLLHAAKYVFPPEYGPVTRGLPTSFAAPAFPKMSAGDELPPVWPDPQGEVRGQALLPLYRSAPGAARRDPLLYEVLALVDALRSGKARERELAKTELLRHLKRGKQSAEK